MRLDFSGILNHRGLIESFIFIDCVLEDRRKKVRSMATFDLFMKHSLELHLLVGRTALHPRTYKLRHIQNRNSHNRKSSSFNLYKNLIYAFF